MGSTPRTRTKLFLDRFGWRPGRAHVREHMHEQVTDYGSGRRRGGRETAGAAIAGYSMRDREDDYARVVDVKPVEKTIRTPRQVCHDETVSQQAPVKDGKQVTGSVLGAVVGGVVGHQIGGGDGKKVATAAGAAAGGYAGNRVQKRMQDGRTVTTTEQRCETLYDLAHRAARIRRSLSHRRSRKRRCAWITIRAIASRCALDSWYWMKLLDEARVISALGKRIAFITVKISSVRSCEALRYFDSLLQVQTWQLLFPARALSSGPCPGISAHTGYPHDRDLAPRRADERELRSESPSGWEQ